jgi:hypothetical protein
MKKRGDKAIKRTREMLIAELRQKIAVGTKQADRGEFLDAEAVFARLRRKSAERRSRLRRGKSKRSKA